MPPEYMMPEVEKVPFSNSQIRPKIFSAQAVSCLKCIAGYLASTSDIPSS